MGKYGTFPTLRIMNLYQLRQLTRFGASRRQSQLQTVDARIGACETVKVAGNLAKVAGRKSLESLSDFSHAPEPIRG